jgi:hypothetical protein
MPVPTSVAAVVVDADQAELRLRLAGQLLAQADLEGGPPSLAARIRRLRVGLDGHALDHQLRLALQLNVVPGATELIDAWGAFVPGDALEVRFGVFKTPFTRYRDQSYQALLLVDWPVAAKAFGAERQLGVAAGDGRPGEDGLGWSAGVFTGVNTRKAFATLVSDVYGLPLENASDLGDGTGSYALHPEVFLRVTAGTPNMDAATGFDHDGGPARVLVGASGAWDVTPDPAVDFVGRAAVEGLLKVSCVSVGTVGYLGLHDGGGGVQPAAVGGTGEIAWRVDPRLGVAVVGSRVDTLSSLRASARDEAAANPDSGAEGAGALEQTAELGGGATWFLHGTGLAVQLDGAWLRAVSSGVAEDGARVRLQVQLVL